VHGVETTPGVLRVTVQGAGFTRVRRVMVADARASQVQVASPQKLVATVADLGRGFGDVEVVTSHGTSPKIQADRIVLGPLRGATQLVAHPSAHSVRLTWAAPRQGVTGIVVRRGTGHFPRSVHEGTGVRVVRATNHSVVDKGVKSATTYRYSVFVRYAGRGDAKALAHVRARTHTGSTDQQVLVGALLTLLALVLVWAAVRYKLRVRPTPSLTRKANHKGLVVGGDNRTSTSKATALIWTVVLVFFLITTALLAGFDMARYTSLLGKTDKLYLVLIGGPFAAAWTANRVVLDRLARNPNAKSKAERPQIADVLTDDNGDTDLVDTQYVLFNVVVAATVVIQFGHAPFSGLPGIPGFLAALTGVSAATYTANKGSRSGS
jgi:hypothetical protein